MFVILKWEWNSLYKKWYGIQAIEHCKELFQDLFVLSLLSANIFLKSLITLCSSFNEFSRVGELLIVDLKVKKYYIHKYWIYRCVIDLALHLHEKWILTDMRKWS